MNEIRWNRALITGVCGFTGSHLAEALALDGVEVHGADLAGADRRNLASLEGRIALHEADLTNPGETARVLRKARPEAVFHLAGRIGGQDLDALLRANVVATEVLLRALAVEGAEKTKAIVVAGSAAEYGPVAKERLPIAEDERLRPVNLYGVSKVAQSMAAEVVARRWRLPLIRTRTFNITGPREPVALVGASFAEQIARIEAGERPPKMLVGPLGGTRDFTDVRDVVRAYVAATRCEAAVGGVFNVCSGVGTTIRTILDRLLALSKVAVEIAPNPALAGRTDDSVFVGNGARAKAAFGWTPGIPLDRSLRDLRDHWTARVGESAR